MVVFFCSFGLRRNETELIGFRLSAGGRLAARLNGAFDPHLASTAATERGLIFIQFGVISIYDLIVSCHRTLRGLFYPLYTVRIHESIPECPQP